MESYPTATEQANADKLASAMRGLQWKPNVDLGPSRKTETVPLPAARSSLISSAMAPIKSRHESGGEQQFLAASEESIMLKHIKDGHSPDGVEIPYDSKFVLLIIEEIILRASTVVPGIEHKVGVQARLEELEREILNSGFTDLRDELAYPINKLSSELICKTHAAGDGKKITEELFQFLAHFSWEAKVVIAFGAFAKIYGEYWLVADLFRTNPLARSVGILMEVDEIVGTSAEAFKPKFKAVTDLVNAMLEVTKTIFEFNDLLSKHDIASDAEEKIAANLHIPVAAYWCIRSIVACSSILLNLMAMGHEYITSALEAWELGSLAHKLAQIKDHMQEQKNFYRLKLEEVKENRRFQDIKRFFEMAHLDNMKILKALFCAIEDQLPLYDGTLKARTTLEVLRKKNVLLLISGLHMPPQEFDILLQLYNESRQPSISHENRYEFVWLPVIDRSVPLTPETLQQFQLVQDSMPWYSIAHPSFIDPAVIRFIKEVWKYDNKPLLVVLDPQGKVSNYNAFNMLWIWGSLAFPFTDSREEALWNGASWNMELLADAIDQTVQSWLSGGKFVCLYGGEDLVWIRKFTGETRKIARQLNIDLEMIYVGKANPNERVRRINETIQRENLSNTFPDISHIWFFWVRLNCMWNSREKHGVALEYDEKMKQVITILTYDSSDVEWAVFGRGGTGETAKHQGEVMLQTLEDFANWRNLVVDRLDFVLVLNEQLRGRHPKTHCSRLFYPGASSRAPPSVICPECNRAMERFLMYRCCTD